MSDVDITTTQDVQALPVQMTRFKVNLDIDLETSKLDTVGSPRSWDWARIISGVVDGGAFNDASVRLVMIDSVYTADENGRMTIQSEFTPVYETPGTMDLADAFQVVVDLAKQNIIADKYVDSDELRSEQAQQQEAVLIVEDFAVNHLGDD